ncbi:hypothetical protein FHW36_110163 [Chitinophaga polysaccharea]|uniref:Uncharacterized protein n=1 Tax=Chitinophaga polysaccharea TaxID=1293035 RepID=A0A561P9Z6_9BACT|nr:hypothetical protein [Chitinophaga polysaccharea]TWF34962.1 hypothetical protein FHW36_110163 [Chitinophaga polysaccharea]
MTLKIYLSAFLVLTLFSCHNIRVQNPPPPHSPKALEDKSSFEIISKRGDGVDLVESLYDELVSKDAALKRLEVNIDGLNNSKEDSTELFDKFNGKIQSYFRSADRNISAISDSLLRDKMKLLIANHLTTYQARTVQHSELLKTLAENETSISDLHQVLKIVRTLPVIEKYQQDNLPDTKQLKGFITQQNQTIALADSLVKK